MLSQFIKSTIDFLAKRFPYLSARLRQISEQERAQKALLEERDLLAQQLADRTADLSRVQTELAMANRLKNGFLASMSHELRTPLSVVLGMSQVLRADVYGPLTEEQLNAVGYIEKSGLELLELINHILDLYKIEADKLYLEIDPVYVEAICRTSLDVIKPLAQKKEIKLCVAMDNRVTTIPADARRLQQILVNLLSNAVKFTPEEGQVGLEVSGDETLGMVHFTIWDTGIGISAENMGYLFQPFIQLDSKLSRRYEGTGLGLVLASRLADLHGGRISVESKEGEGSRFTVSLPWPHP